ncbi:MAG: MBL fold metallo-hydrolase [Synechococcus sp. ELA057]|jgi:glyoxylase-like metal-dependent hydrolase (beta-lactamase superfamily II)
MEALFPPAAPEGRPPVSVAEGLWVFPPNRETKGGSAWLLQSDGCTVLVDLPALNAVTIDWLQHRGGVAAGERRTWIVLTGRDGHGRCRAWQEALGWPVIVQEQEAYLLPSVRLESFSLEHRLAPGLDLLWTPGPSPGACVLHCHGGSAGDGLFCGRLLLPAGPGRLMPLRRRSTFHWPRQLQSLERLRRWLPAGSPDWIASGGGLGALRGEKRVGNGDSQLASLDLSALADQPVDGE